MVCSLRRSAAFKGLSTAREIRQRRGEIGRTTQDAASYMLQCEAKFASPGFDDAASALSREKQFGLS
jgi:hypothetical protein